MIIKLNDKYKIVSDSYSYSLQKYTHFVEGSKEKGKWETIGYYGSFDHLTKALINYEIKTSDMTSFNEVSSLINRLYKEIVKEIERVAENGLEQ